MIKYFSKAFKVTNENIILATPVILFLFLLSLYLGVAQRVPANLTSAILLLATIVFMLSAFAAGWFFMVKKAVDLSKKEFVIEEEKAKASFHLIKEVPVGIGEYFFSFLGGLFLWALLMGLFVFVFFQTGLHFIGKVGIDLLAFKMALGSTVAMKSLISSLSTEQLTKLNTWNFLFMGFMTVFSFITMFWPAQITFKTKNPLLAFFKSLQFTFQKFLGSFVLFVYISVINFIISLINAFSMVNPIIYFISMLVYFYFVVYVIVLVFLYYDGESQPKIEDKYEQSCCDCGSDSDGQEQSGDTDSTEE